MFKPCAVLVILGASSLLAQSRVDLLQRVADRYKNANSFLVKGTASTDIPGTSWRAAYDFETEFAQPAFLPISVRTPSPRVDSMVGKFTETQIDGSAKDPKPERKFVMTPFGRYNEILRHLVSAEKIGTETITLQGHVHACEVIDAVYDNSPEFKPHSQIVHKHLSIDPTELLVLRETQPADGGLEWTVDVTFSSFDQAPSEAMVQALKAFAAQAKDRPDWIGRTIPDLTLTQLSGSSINLAELRGKPILLDFWGSYCGPCRLTTLHAQELATRYKSSGLTVLTFTQDTVADAKLWTGHYHVSLPVLLDPDGKAFKAFDVQGVPVAILIGADGKVIHYWVGLDDLSVMDSALSATLQPHSVSADNTNLRH